MKYLTLIFLFSLSALAQKGGNFEQKKQRVLEKMGPRTSIIDQGISCVQRASNHQAIKSCRQQMKSQAQALKGNRKGRN